MEWIPCTDNEKVCKDCHYNDGGVHAECIVCDKAENRKEFGDIKRSDCFGDKDETIDDTTHRGVDEHIWQELSVKEKSMELKDTEELMESADYVERFKAEYYQTKIRYEKLKKLNTKIEAGQFVMHDSPEYILRNQQKHMGEYLHDLELRAEIEGVVL